VHLFVLLKYLTFDKKCNRIIGITIFETNMKLDIIQKFLSEISSMSIPLLKNNSAKIISIPKVRDRQKIMDTIKKIH
jgi:nitrate reductase NapAB chaperone NapD